MSSSSLETSVWQSSKYLTGVWSRPILWVGKGTLAVMDQGLISGSNFFLSIVLARWLRPEQYGAYALAFSGFMLMAAVYQALFLEPMSVLGPVVYGDRKREYLGVLLRMHGILAFPILAALGVLIIVSGEVGLGAELRNALAGVVLATPCILFFWLARQACYLELSPGLAATGAVFYCALITGGLSILLRKGLFSPFAAFLLMAGGAIAVSGFLLIRLKPKFKQTTGHPTVGEVWARHWRYGGWELGTMVVGWAEQNICYGLVGAVLGMAEVGALRALINLALPVVHTTTALRRMVQPHVSGISDREGHSATKVSVKTITLVSVIGGCAYFVLVSVFSGPIFGFLYGGKFKEFAYLVPWLTLGIAITMGTNGFIVGLRAIQSPSSVFVVYCTSAAVNALVGIPAIRIFGLPGLIGTTIAASITTMGVAGLMFRQKTNVGAEVSGNHG
jgi:O-antigen/teichoic acid export membrane protein